MTKQLADLTDSEIRAQLEAEIERDRERAARGLILEDEWKEPELTPDYLAYLERRAVIARQMLAERGIVLPDTQVQPEHVSR